MAIKGQKLWNYSPEDSRGNLTSVVSHNGAVVHTHCINLNKSTLNLNGGGLAVGDIIPLLRVKAGSRLQNLTIKATKPNTPMTAPFSFTGTFGAINSNISLKSQTDASDFIPFMTGDGAAAAAIALTPCTHLWFTGWTQADGNVADTVESGFSIQTTARIDGEDYSYDLGNSGVNLLFNPESSTFSAAALESTINQAARSASVAANMIDTVFPTAYGEVNVGMQLDMALCDAKARDGTVQGVINSSVATGAVPIIELDGSPDANGVQHYINSSYKPYRGSSEFGAALVITGAMNAIQAAALDIVVTVDEIRNEASARTYGSNISGYRVK